MQIERSSNFNRRHLIIALITTQTAAQPAVADRLHSYVEFARDELTKVITDFRYVLDLSYYCYCFRLFNSVVYKLFNYEQKKVTRIVSKIKFVFSHYDEMQKNSTN